jgi:signal peptidase I
MPAAATSSASRFRAVRACAHALVACAIGAILVDTWLVAGLWRPMVVCGPSMGPQAEGERVVVLRAAYAWRTPRRFEAVVLRSPDEPGTLCLKRVVGFPGELVELAAGDVLIDGVPAGREPALAGLYYEPGLNPQYRLGPAEYFVLGDQSAVSLDSRAWSRRGGVNADLLLGPAVVW